MKSAKNETDPFYKTQNYFSKDEHKSRTKSHKRQKSESD